MRRPSPRRETLFMPRTGWPSGVAPLVWASLRKASFRNILRPDRPRIRGDLHRAELDTGRPQADGRWSAFGGFLNDNTAATVRLSAWASGNAPSGFAVGSGTVRLQRRKTVGEARAATVGYRTACPRSLEPRSASKARSCVAIRVPPTWLDHAGLRPARRRPS